MTPERIAELRNQFCFPGKSNLALMFNECLDEIERMGNIVTIQQNQMERLMDARDAEIVKNRKLTCPTKPTTHDH